MKNIKYWLEINIDQVPEFHTAIAHELAGGAFISFEGYLSECEPLKIASLSTSETEILKRKAIVPILDLVVIPLEPYTVDEILERVLNDPCLASAIVHIEIAKDNQIEFGAYDHFQPTFCGPSMSRSLLNSLLQSGVLLSITPAE